MATLHSPSASASNSALDPSSPSPLTTTTTLQPIRPSPERLGMTFDKRLLLALTSSFFCGFTLGASHSGHLSSLRFRAENAHRLPISQPGWYLYHKSKNYAKAKDGIISGVRRGAHLATWTSIFFIVEESMDVFRGTWRAGRTLREMEGVDELDMKDMGVCVEGSRDFVSSGVAGMVTAGIWSAWNAFPMVMAARTIRMGVLVGVGFGAAQDGLTWLRARVGEGGSWDGRGAGEREEGKD
ncbi:hypothetical protein B0J11DRAFT_491025 [Dendryphion nanum]|uniref:Uncharacterized protein n=1 Tax=Dendryphion nanum TaxID=256645 RepID=A0A9P9DLE6_9PLEO|nr:hypothetical protein B0J11DRAFT_491025 [Dendryphion nanum]